MFTIIDKFLNAVTMYKITLYYLFGLIFIAIGFSVFGILPYNPFDIAIDVSFAIAICGIANLILAKIFNAVTNSESVYITALILVLIIPVRFPVNITFLGLACVAAMGAKYILTIERRHIFNPAAAAVLAIALLSAEHTATWWVGTPILLPFVMIGGLLVVRKIRRESLVFTFLGVFFLLTTLSSFVHGGTFLSMFTIWKLSMLHSALFFFAFVMLTEPLTSPAMKKPQMLFSAIIAFFYATPQLRLLGLGFTPEMALCVGNVASYFISPNYRLLLTLREKIKLSSDTLAISFHQSTQLNFKPGQYMEWTLPHEKVDNRGNRRYFSIASSPTEQDLLMMIKFYVPSSSYKKALYLMKPGQQIVAAQLAGDFVMPEDTSKPIVFIAGGVGVAPFRSMIKYVVDMKKSVDIVLFYANRTQDEIAFNDVFSQASNFGVKTVYVLTDKKSIQPGWMGKTGYLTFEMIRDEVKDYMQRLYYISGPQLMVQNYQRLLESMGIDRRHIIVDFFPGYTEAK